MKLPKNGRIVIVDDKIGEAMPLIQTLSSNEYPVVYFNGDHKNLPDKPLVGVRVLFLDMNLLSNDIMSEKNILSTSKAVVSTLINKNNGPIIIILWSKHKEYVEEMKRHLSSCFNIVKILVWDKNDFSSDGHYNLTRIEDAINNEIDGMQSIELFLEWENLIHTSTSEIVNQISEFYTFDDHWDKNMRAIFYKLAESYKGKKIETPFSGIFKDSMFSLNSILSDHVNKQTLKSELADLDDINKEDEGLDRDPVNPKINTKLLISIREKYFPGNIYTNLPIVKPNAQDVLCVKTGECSQEKQIEPIFLEITPICDYTQDKMKKARILPGFLYPKEVKTKKALYIYSTSMIEWEDKIYGLVFDFRYFTSVDINCLKDSDIKFGLQSEQLADIQSRLASHINRIGTVGVDYQSPKCPQPAPK